MNFLHYLRDIYFSFLFSYAGPEWPGWDSVEAWLSPEEKTSYEWFLGKLEWNQKDKFETWFNSLDDKKQKDFVNYIPNIGNNLDSFLEKLDKIASWTEERKSLFDQYRAKFEWNNELLERIDKIEWEIQESLKPYIEYNENYTFLLNELLLRDGDSADSEYAEVAGGLSQRIHDIEMRKERVWKLEIQLQTMETSIQVERREDLLYWENGSSKLLEAVNSKPELELTDAERDLKNVLNWKSFDELTSWDFYTLKKSWYDLSKLLLVKQNGSAYESVSKETMWVWDSFVVNYWRNRALDKIVWAWDVLDITNVKSIKVNGVEWTRKANPRPGYYTPEWHYLAIHDGYKIEITDTAKLEGQELINFNESAQRRFEQIRWQDIMTYLQNNLDKVEHIWDWERLNLPFKSSWDIEYLKENFLDKLPETYKDKVTYNEEVWSFDTIWWVSFKEISEVTKWYPNVRNNLTKLIREKWTSLESKKLLLDNFDEVVWFEITDNSRKVDFIQNAIDSFIPERHKWWVKVEFDWANISLDLWDADLTLGKLFMDYEYNWTRNTHEQYMNEINAAAVEFWVPSWAIIQLIYHENRWWNPRIKAVWSSAYGLWQMIDDTWRRFWNGWNRHDPGDQLMATAKYMKYLKETKNCSWEEVLAYYNTWEGIFTWKINLNLYYRLNTPIVNKIPAWTTRSREAYFTWAVAYYNGISYSEALAKRKW